MGSAVCGSRIKGLVANPDTGKGFSETLPESGIILYENECHDTENTFILDLSLKCSNLYTQNRFQLVNPVAYIFTKENNEFVKTLETEIQTSTLNPVFEKAIRTAYTLRKDLEIKIEVHDANSKSQDNGLIGSVLFCLHEIAFCNHFISKELSNSSKRTGVALISAKENKFLNSKISMQWEFLPVENTNDYYFFKISLESLYEAVPIYQSESRPSPYGNSYIAWEKFCVGINRLCKGDENRSIFIEVFKLDHKSILIGSSRFNLSLIQSERHLKLEGSMNYEFTGTLNLMFFSCDPKNSFLNRIRSGIEIFPIYAIDFSEFQGHSDQNLLENPYLKPINRIQNILKNYANDPLYPVLGTGGFFKNFSLESNCFALTNNIFQPEIVNHRMLEDYYTSILPTLSSTGKGIVGDLIELVIKFVNYNISDLLKYYFLIIVSSGNPTDLELLRSKYSDAYTIPLSIIFIRAPSDNKLPIQNFEKITNSPFRDYFRIFESSEIEKILDHIQTKVSQYSNFKTQEKKPEKFKILRSTTMKLSPEKLRNTNSYFANIKSDYIKYLKDINHSPDQIEEITKIGIPFIPLQFDRKIGFPIRIRSKTLIRQRSLKNQESSCNYCKIFGKDLVKSPCGCVWFCINCVNDNNCPECFDKSVVNTIT
jgi:Copine/C2 domain